MQRRTVVLGGLAALAGCAALDPDATDTPDDDAPPVQAGPGEYPHAIHVENAWDQPVHLRLAVERGGSTLYEETHRVDPGSRTVVAGFTVEALPEGRRYVTVAASTPRHGTASAGVSVTRCLGDVIARVAPDGELSVIYALC